VTFLVPVVDGDSPTVAGIHDDKWFVQEDIVYVQSDDSQEIEKLVKRGYLRLARQDDDGKQVFGRHVLREKDKKPQDVLLKAQEEAALRLKEEEEASLKKAQEEGTEALPLKEEEQATLKAQDEAAGALRLKEEEEGLRLKVKEEVTLKKAQEEALHEKAAQVVAEVEPQESKVPVEEEVAEAKPVELEVSRSEEAFAAASTAPSK
jgi:hypothetical protein